MTNFSTVTKREFLKKLSVLALFGIFFASFFNKGKQLFEKKSSSTANACTPIKKDPKAIAYSKIV